MILKGDFRVGDLFVEQDTGTVNFRADALNIDPTSGATFTDGLTQLSQMDSQELILEI